MQVPDVVVAGIVFGEQPRWHEGRLWFSDWGTKEVVAVDLDGTPGHVPGFVVSALCRLAAGWADARR